MTVYPGALSEAAWLKAAPSIQLIEAFGAFGEEARFAGGCVRDGLLSQNKSVPDIDVATTAKPETVLRICERYGFRAIPTGIDHGTQTVIANDWKFEVTTLRRDVETDGRHAIVEFTSDFQADAARRDLTINAMSCDLDGQVYDYFGGFDDLKAGRVRFVGEPIRRIREDYLRILRFFRFFARFGRAVPEQHTLDAIRQLAGGLSRISGERIQKELRYLLVAPKARQALEWMAESGVSAALFSTSGRPEFLNRTCASGDWLIELAVWLRGSAQIQSIDDRLKLSGRDREDLGFWLSHDLPGTDFGILDLRRALFLWGRRRSLGLVHLAQAFRPGFDTGHALELFNAEPKAPVFPLQGRDLLGLGLEPGVKLGQLLKRIEHEWLSSGCMLDREACLLRARRLIAAETA